MPWFVVAVADYDSFWLQDEDDDDRRAAPAPSTSQDPQECKQQ